MTLNDPVVCAHHPYCSLDEGELRMWKSRWTRLALYIQFLVLSGSAMWGKPNLEAMILRWSDDPAVQEELAERMSQCFNVGVVVYKLASVVAGFFLDYFGPRTSGVVGVLLHAIGVVLLAVDGLDTMYFQLAVPLILLSNQYTWNACLWASQLFPRQKKLVLSLISVSGDVSKFNYYWLLLLNLRGDAEFSTLFWWMFVVVLAEVLVPLLTMPADPDRIVVSVLEKRAQQKMAMEAANNTVVPQGVYFYHGLSMRTQMLTPYFLIFMVTHSLMFLSLTAQTNQFTFFMNGVSGSNPAWVSSQLGWFNFYNFLSIAGGLLYGASADYIPVSYLLLLQCITGTLAGGVMFIILRFFTVDAAGPLVHFYFIVCTVHKCYIMGMNYAFVSDVFGYTNVGVLCGLNGAASAVLVALDYIVRVLFRREPYRYAAYLTGTCLMASLLCLAIITLPPYHTAGSRSKRSTVHILPYGTAFSATMQKRHCVRCGYDCVCLSRDLDDVPCAAEELDALDRVGGVLIDELISSTHHKQYSV